MQRKGGRDVQNLIHLRLCRLRHAAAGISRKRFEISAGALRIQYAQRKRGFSRTGHARNADDLAQGHVHIDIFQIVHPRTADLDMICHIFLRWPARLSKRRPKIRIRGTGWKVNYFLQTKWLFTTLFPNSLADGCNNMLEYDPWRTANPARIFPRPGMIRENAMKAIKFLWDRHLDFITWISTAGFPAWWKVLIGFLEILCIICVFILSWIFTTWYFALAITAGSILGICIACCIAELFVRLILKIVRQCKKQP